MRTEVATHKPSFVDMSRDSGSAQLGVLNQIAESPSLDKALRGICWVRRLVCV